MICVLVRICVFVCLFDCLCREPTEGEGQEDLVAKATEDFFAMLEAEKKAHQKRRQQRLEIEAKLRRDKPPSPVPEEKETAGEEGGGGEEKESKTIESSEGEANKESSENQTQWHVRSIWHVVAFDDFDAWSMSPFDILDFARLWFLVDDR